MRWYIDYRHICRKPEILKKKIVWQIDIHKDIARYIKKIGRHMHKRIAWW